MTNIMDSHVMKLLTYFHENGMDRYGKDESLKVQLPFWTKLLDDDYGTPEYGFTLAFVKKMYRVFRNYQGTHKLLCVEEEKKSISDKKRCCNNCKYKKRLTKYDYSQGGCKHTEMEGYACLAPDFVCEGDAIWMVGLDETSQCECWGGM